MAYLFYSSYLYLAVYVSSTRDFAKHPVDFGFPYTLDISFSGFISTSLWTPY